MVTKYVLRRTRAGQFMFRLRTRRKRVLLTSSDHSSKGEARQALELVRAASSDRQRYERLASDTGKQFFVVVTKEGETLARSSLYSSSEALEGGIQTVREKGRVAPVSDCT